MATYTDGVITGTENWGQVTHTHDRGWLKSAFSTTKSSTCAAIEFSTDTTLHLGSLRATAAQMALEFHHHSKAVEHLIRKSRHSGQRARTIPGDTLVWAIHRTSLREILWKAPMPRTSSALDLLQVWKMRPNPRHPSDKETELQVRRNETDARPSTRQQKLPSRNTVSRPRITEKTSQE